MDPTFKENVTQESTWMRLVYMILFAVIFNIAEFVITVVVVVQFLFKLFVGRVNENLRALGQTLASYVYEIIVYLTFHTDDMPYPFGPWPTGAPGATKRRLRKARASKDEGTRRTPKPPAAGLAEKS